MKTNNSNVNKGFLVIVFAFLLMVAFAFAFTGVNTVVDSNVVTTVETTAEAIKKVVKMQVECIDGVYCLPGTHERITIASQDVLDDAEAQAIIAINRYYDSMLTGVDPYLDWYYSLGGQYSQLWNMVKGLFGNGVTSAMESYISEKMASYITPSEDLSGTIQRIFASSEEKIDTLASSIIRENTIQVKDDGSVEYVIQYESTLQDIIADISPAGFRNEGKIAVGGIIAGTASSVLIKNIIAKAMSSTVSKTAVKTLGKIALKAVPVFGIVIGVGVDLFGNYIDETVNRDAYKAEIVGAVNSERYDLIESTHAVFNDYVQSSAI